MEKQENNIKDKVLYNNVNSTIVILEEREIEQLNILLKFEMYLK